MAGGPSYRASHVCYKLAWVPVEELEFGGWTLFLHEHYFPGSHSCWFLSFSGKGEKVKRVVFLHQFPGRRPHQESHGRGESSRSKPSKTRGHLTFSQLPYQPVHNKSVQLMIMSPLSCKICWNKEKVKEKKCSQALQTAVAFTIFQILWKWKLTKVYSSDLLQEDAEKAVRVNWWQRDKQLLWKVVWVSLKS